MARVLLSAWWTLDHLSRAEEVEAVACLEGIHLALEWVKMPTEIETDCAVLLKAIKCKDVRWSRWAGIIAEIKLGS
jgi:hypothetical protein